VGWACPSCPRRSRQRYAAHRFAPVRRAEQIKREPKSFAGRKLGIVVSDDAPAKLVEAVEALPAIYQISAPEIGGATLDAGRVTTSYRPCWPV
jgi:hypothetical protein